MNEMKMPVLLPVVLDLFDGGAPGGGTTPSGGTTAGGGTTPGGGTTAGGRFKYWMLIPAWARAGKLGDSKAPNWSEERLVLRLPRRRTPLK